MCASAQHIIVAGNTSMTTTTLYHHQHHYHCGTSTSTCILSIMIIMIIIMLRLGKCDSRRGGVQAVSLFADALGRLPLSQHLLPVPPPALAPAPFTSRWV